MTEIRIPAPSEQQKLFLRARERYVAYGGARGGGKSWAIRVKAILLCFGFPGIKILIVRKIFDELRKNHVLPLCEMLGKTAKYIGNVNEFHFANGSIIFLRSCSNAKDVEKFQGTETDILFIDEGTQFTDNDYNKIRACVRGVNNFPKRTYVTCNPGGVGHAWVKRLFVDRTFRENENPDDYVFFPAKVTDNKALMQSDPGYVTYLEGLPPKLRKAWLDGDWNIFEGQYFEEFKDDPRHYKDRLFTHVIDPFEIPPYFPIYRSFDWGSSKPFSCDWWTIDEDGRAYLILQYYGWNGQADEGLKLPPDKVFAKIAEIERSHRWLAGKKIIGVADSAIWDRQTGIAIIDYADKCGVHFQKSDKTRLAGWMQCRYRFYMDETGKPMVYFFNTCKNAIRTIPLLQYSEHEPEDLDTKGEDHFADSMRYFFMMMPMKAKIEAEQKFKELDPLSQTQTKYNRFNYL